METPAHSALRLQAVRFLFERGCCAAATEVVCPIAKFRLDAAGYLDPLPQSRERPPGSWRMPSASTVIIECKQSRADFLRDSRTTPALLSRRSELEAARLCLEQRIIRVAEPELRRGGSSLFAELESWDFDRSRLGSYRRIVAELRRIDMALHGQTKFWLLRQYRLADHLYLAAPRGTLEPAELPPGWGLLEPDAEACDGEPSIRVRTEAPHLTARDVRRMRLLRNIAAACSRRDLARLAVRKDPAEAGSLIDQTLD